MSDESPVRTVRAANHIFMAATAEQAMVTAVKYALSFLLDPIVDDGAPFELRVECAERIIHLGLVKE